MKRYSKTFFILFCLAPLSFALDADFNYDGETNFTDFLTLSRNYPKASGATFAQGDVNGDGDIDFLDFLTLAQEFGDEGGITLDTKSALETVNENFLDSKEYAILGSAFDSFTEDLLIDDVDNTVICFSDDLTGGDDPFPNIVNIDNCTNLRIVDLKVEASETFSSNSGYGTDYGVINVLNSNKNATSIDDGVWFENLDVENTYTYTGSTISTQSSCALNISESTVLVDDSSIKSRGKSTVLIHDLSNVEVNDSTVEGYYYVFNTGASDLAANDTTLICDAGFGDNHPAMWTSVSYSATNGGPATKSDMEVTMTDCTFTLENGKGILAGNTNKPDEAISADVFWDDPTIEFPSNVNANNFGLVGYAGNWVGITLTYSGGTVNHSSGTVSIASQLVPLTISTSATPSAVSSVAENTGLGKYVSYQNLNGSGELDRPQDSGFFPTLVDDNLVSVGLDVLDFDPNDPDDAIYD